MAQLCGFQRARTLAHHFTLTFSVPNVNTISLEAVIVLRCCFFCFGPYYIFVSIFFLILTVRVPISVSAVLWPLSVLLWTFLLSVVLILLTVFPPFPFFHLALFPVFQVHMILSSRFLLYLPLFWILTCTLASKG